MDVFRMVIVDKGPLLLSIMYACLVLWVGFSTLMYYTERNNPIASVAKERKRKSLLGPNPRPHPHPHPN